MLLILGGIASGIELIVLGRVTPVVLAFDSVGAGLLPLGILSLFVTPIDPTGRGPESSPGEDDGGGGGGGGGGRAGSRPLPPTGGLGIDWPRFEREFRAYAERVTAAPAAR